MDYCSPLALENVSAKQFSCLSYDKLVELLKAWNDVHPKKEHIPFPKKPTIENVYAGLKKAFMKKNIQSAADWTWFPRAARAAPRSISDFACSSGNRRGSRRVSVRCREAGR